MTDLDSKTQIRLTIPQAVIAIGLIVGAAGNFFLLQSRVATVEDKLHDVSAELKDFRSEWSPRLKPNGTN
jgi:hypothetical protein